MGLFETLTALIARDREIIDRATVYRAREGMRPAYDTHGEAEAYDAAFRLYPAQPFKPTHQSAWTGWADAERIATWRDDERGIDRDEAEQRRQRRDGE